MLQARLANGVESSHKYDAEGRLVGTTRRGSAWETRFDYQLDPAGYRVALTQSTTALAPYAVPAVGRLDAGGAGAAWGSALPVGEAIRYSYDALERLGDATSA